jgi:hypothetical protein
MKSRTVPYLPFLEKRSIREIKRPDLLEAVARIERRGALRMARFARGWLRQMFRYALVKVPGLGYNYASDLDVVAVPQRPTPPPRSCAWPRPHPPWR